MSTDPYDHVHADLATSEGMRETPDPAEPRGSGVGAPEQHPETPV